MMQLNKVAPGPQSGIGGGAKPEANVAPVECLLYGRPVRFVRLAEVKRTVGLGKTTIYGMIKKGEFPHPVPIGGRAVGWVESEIAQWANDRIAKARLAPTQQTLALAA